MLNICETMFLSVFLLQDFYSVVHATSYLSRKTLQILEAMGSSEYMSILFCLYFLSPSTQFRSFTSHLNEQFRTKRNNVY